MRMIVNRAALFPLPPSSMSSYLQEDDNSHNVNGGLIVNAIMLPIAIHHNH